MNELMETIMDTLIATVANPSVAPVTNCLAISGLGCFIYGDLKEHGYGRTASCHLLAARPVCYFGRRKHAVSPQT